MVLIVCVVCYNTVCFSFMAAKVFYFLQFGAKLARAQSMSARSHPQTQASAPHPQNIFKRVSHTAVFVKTPQGIEESKV